jgi:hypothetical protein
VVTCRRSLRPRWWPDMLDALEAEESTFEADELSEEGNPTRE